MDFYGEVKEVVVGGEYVMAVRMGKGLIVVYHKDRNTEWIKNYEVKLGEPEDLWCLDETRLIVVSRKYAQVEIY